MLKNMKIGKKIISALTITLLIIAVVVAISVLQLNKVKDGSEHMENISLPATQMFTHIGNGALEMAGDIRNWELTRTEDKLADVNHAYEKILSGLKEFDELAQKYPEKTAVVSEEVNELKQILVNYKEKVDETVTGYQEVDRIQTEIVAFMDVYMKNCYDYLDSQQIALENELSENASNEKISKRTEKMKLMNDIIDYGNSLKLAFKIDNISIDAGEIYESEKYRFDDIKTFTDKIRVNTSRDVNIQQLNKINESTNQFKELAQKTVSSVENIHSIKAERKVLTKSFLEKSLSIQEQAITAAETIGNDNLNFSNQTMLIMIVGFIGALILGFLITFIIVRMITKPLKEMTEAAEVLATGDVDISINIDSKDEIGIMAKAFSSIIEHIKTLAYAIEKIADGNLDVEINERSEKDILSKSLLSTMDSLNVLLNETEMLGDSISRGNLGKKGDESVLKGSWKELMIGINSSLDNFRDIIDSMPVGVLSMDTEFNILYANKAAADKTGSTKENIKMTKCYNSLKTGDCQTENCACAKALIEKRMVASETIANPNGKQIDVKYNGVPIMDKEGNVVGVQEFIIDQTEIKNGQRLIEKQANYQENEVEKLIVNLDKLAKGNLNIKTFTEPTDNDTKEVGENFRKINESLESSVSSIRGYINELSEILSQMAKGNMDVGITSNYLGDFVAIKNAVNLISDSLNKVLGEINVAADQVNSGSKQVSDSSQALSQGATEQASSTEEINSSVELIAKQTKDNAEFANQANDLGVLAKKDAEAGNSQMGEMLSAMQDINKSSADISKIIKVIDEIAFQTNILALNAAVEAARAGQHGKGFAVVAEEVRNLAARSANAAKETTDLIEGSIKMVESGTEIANNTAKSLEQIVEGIGKVTDLVSKIADASNEQATGVSQIKQGIDQVTEVTQMNTATAEESASASEELSGQASMLKNMISKFTLRELGGGRKVEDSHYMQTEYNYEQISPSNSEEMLPEIDISLDDDDFGKY